MNKKRVERIWRCEGLKVPAKQPNGVDSGSTTDRASVCGPNAPTTCGRTTSSPTAPTMERHSECFVIDEFTRESMAIRVARKLKSTDVIEALADLFVLRGVPATSALITARSSLPWRFGNGLLQSVPRLPTSSQVVRGRTAIARASTESCAMNYSTGRSSTRCGGQDRDRNWRRHYNTIRPHSSLGYKPPAPEVFVPAFAAWPAALRRPAPPATLPLAQRPTLN